MTTAFDNALIQWIQQQQAHKPLCLGICGAQGSGKSTLARQLASQLDKRSWRVAVISIDDLYLSRQVRAELAKKVHPLLQTRGVPGTHDVARGIQLLQNLKHLAEDQSLLVPRFNKAEDNPAPLSSWPSIQGPLDAILFEGWCIGLPPQGPSELEPAINALERDEDRDGHWRRWVNQNLAGDYQNLWAQLDKLIFLQTPDWDSVLRWRTQQEKENAESGGQHVMNTHALERFVQHYERLTRHALNCMPARAHVLRRLGRDHEVLSQEIRT